MGIVDDRVIKVGDAGADDSKPGRPTRPWLSLQETGITEHSFAGSLFKTAPLVVLVLDIEGKIVLFNPYTEELTGFGLEEARGRDWFGVFLPDHVREQSRKRFKVALRARQRQGPAVTPIVTKGGHRRLVQWHDVALRDAQGGVVGLLAVGQDVTDRRQAERDLKESEKQLRKSDWAKDAVMRNTIEALTHPFYTIDAETYEVVLANSAAKKGMVKEGGACYALTHGRDEPCSGADHPCPLQIVKQSGEACTVEHVHGEDPGPPGIFEIYAYPLMDSEGKVAQIIEYSMDITERRRAEDRLELEKEQFRALVEESPLGVAMISPDGRYEYLSSKFVEMFGYTLEDIPTGLDWFSKAFPDPEYRKLVVTDWINYS